MRLRFKNVRKETRGDVEKSDITQTHTQIFERFVLEMNRARWKF